MSGKSGRSASEISAIRAAVGISAMKPSEMIEGLDKVAERAEKQEQREAEKRKAGGMGAVNTALHVDETGKRWSRQIKIGIIAGVSVIVLALGIMVYVANRKDTKPAEAREVSRQRLEALKIVASQLRFTNDDDINVEKVKTKLHERIAAELAEVEARIKELKHGRRPVELSDVRLKETLTELHELKDGWGEPLDITLPDADSVQIAVKSSAGQSLPPIIVKIRKKK